MGEFYDYLRELRHYIYDRMCVHVFYDENKDELVVRYDNADDSQRWYVVISKVLQEYQTEWKKYKVGAVAQELMRDIKDE